MRARVAAGVCAGWGLVAFVYAAQSMLGATLRGAASVPLGQAVAGALGQTVPWIPVTLAIVALTLRFPITRERWQRAALVHIGVAPVLAFAANVLIVLSYWITGGSFGSIATLAKEGARWAAVNFHIALFIYAAVLGITQTVLYYRRTRAQELRYAKLEGQLARAHVQALNAQIRPHFLFNTLHTIGQLWRSGRSDAADAMLDHLGALFQRVQAASSRLEIPLSEELAMVRDYLAVEEARFPDRLRATVDASPEAMARDVPPLILQPIVENAVRHGVSAVSTAGRVSVTAQVAGGALRLTVCDDGPGMAAPSAQAGTGLGIANTRERLAQLYGDAARFSIGPAPDGGTLVTIEIRPGQNVETPRVRDA